MTLNRIMIDLLIAVGLLPPEGVCSLTWWWGLCGQMILRAMLAVACATGRANHARQVKGDNPDKKGYSGPPGWGFGVGLRHTVENLLLRKLSKGISWIDLMMMDGKGLCIYFGNCKESFSS
jgi:hypothetical protein